VDKKQLLPESKRVTRPPTPPTYSYNSRLPVKKDKTCKKIYKIKIKESMISKNR